jgi:hypothetical protein
MEDQIGVLGTMERRVRLSVFHDATHHSLATARIRYTVASPNAELTGNTYLSVTLGRKPQNMLASLWSDWFSTLVFAGRLRFGDTFPLGFKHHFGFKLSDPPTPAASACR